MHGHTQTETDLAPLCFIDGAWISGNPPILGPASHGIWMGSAVFDGARAFEGVMPDLDRHCRRLIDSAHAMGLQPPVDAETIEGLVRDGVKRLPPQAELYIRPMMVPELGFIAPEPESTRFILALVPMPMPGEKGLKVGLAPIRRPAPDMAPTDAKAACLYPNAARGVRAVRARGFDSGVVLDPLGNVAELLSANLFLVKDGVAITPAPNGCFLAGITRARVMALLRADGITVVERRVTLDELDDAEEMFSTGNAGKVQPIIRYESRDLPLGPVYQRTRALYWDFAHSNI